MDSRKNFKRNALTVSVLIGLLLFRYEVPFFIFFVFIPIFYFFKNNEKLSQFLFWGIFGGIFFAFLEQYFVANISFFLYLGAAVGYGLFYFSPMFFLLFLLKKNFPYVSEFFCIPVIIFSFWIYNFGYFPIVPFSFMDGLVRVPSFIQIISWGGIYLFLFFLAVINFLIYKRFFLRSKSNVFEKILIIGLFVCFLFSLFFQNNSKKDVGKIEVALIQTGFLDQNLEKQWQNKKEEMKKNKNFFVFSLQDFMIDELLILSQKSIQKKVPDLIVWPEIDCSEAMFKEDSFGKLVLFNKVWTNKIIDFVNLHQVPILISTGIETFDNPDNIYNGAVLIEPGGKFDQFYFKRKLIFFGEFLPANLWFLNQYRKKYGWEKNMVSSNNEESSQKIFRLGEFRFGVLICFENGFEKLSRDWKNQGADFIVNLSNDALFESRKELNYQETASIFRAIENRLPFFRATNVGLTEIIDERGRIIKRLKPFQEGILFSEIAIKKEQSFFSQKGHWFVVIQIIVFFIFLSIMKFRNFLRK